MSAATHRIDAAGVALHAEVEGRGTPLLILHGFTGSGESMAGVARSLAGSHRCVRLDLVGHGRSEAPTDPAHYTMERCVDQVAAALDALEIPRAQVLGYSMGGRTALALAAWSPERVASLLLVGASAGLANPAERVARRESDQRLARRIETDFEGFVDDWMALPLFASQRRLGDDWLAAARAERLRSRPQGLAASLRGMGTGAQPPFHDRLPSLRPPVCWVAGEEDAKFTAIARDLASRSPDARAEIVSGAGHACHLEHPERFAEIARRFFTETAAPLPRPGAERANHHESTHESKGST